MDDSYLKVLQMIENGTLTATEGDKLLEAMETGPAETSAAPGAPREVTAPPEGATGSPPEIATSPEGVPASPPPAGPPPAWRYIWIYPMIGGLLFLALMGVLTGTLVQGGKALGWLACTIPLMLLGTLVAVLAWWSRTARWLHLSVRGKKERVRLSFPLPLRLTAWVLRFVSPWVPQLRDTAVDEVILALAEVDPSEGPLSVEVNDEEEGEEVRVYIG
jgi:hypothetical protein